MQSQYPDKILLSGPLSVTFYFYLTIAESLSDKKRTNLHHTFHAGKPDLDNMIKFYLDVATGIIFHNDSQIAHIIATKQYDLEPRTLLEFTKL